jgi:hypothetical protein
VDRVHGAVDRGQRARRCLADARCAGAGARRCSPATEGEDEPVMAVLTGDGGVAERRCTGGNERRRLDLVTRAKEGAKELGRGGMRCGDSWGSHRPFIGAGGTLERGGRGE